LLNIFINQECNLSCPYCFADKGSMRLSLEDFGRLALWLEESRAPAAAILGGEPTLHPDLPFFLEGLNRAGTAPVLFTNALYPYELGPVLARETANVVVNYEHPGFLTREQRIRREENLGLLSRLGARLSFSKNFWDGVGHYDYLLAGAKLYGAKALRYDLSRPGPGAANRYLSLSEQKKEAENLVRFVKEAEAMGLATGLDCPLPFCAFSPEDLSYLRKASLRFPGVCRPSLDIMPDLSVRHCLPLSGLRAPDATAFAGEWDLLAFFAEAALEMRKGLCPDRPSCPSRGECQGGCLALREEAFPKAFTKAPPEALPDAIPEALGQRAAI
jgi:MoaA/NifB/PqqE/SkfB family radical SAM enzyme